MGEPAAELPYWPRYEQMDSVQRHVYLRWMADGRSYLPARIGYALVFFYGLERRALIEQQDLPLVIEEALRLPTKSPAPAGRRLTCRPAWPNCTSRCRTWCPDTTLRR